MDSKQNLKIAVIGGGYWGKNLVRNFYELGVLHTVCDTDQSIREESVRLCQGISTTSRYEDVLQDEGITGVVIATPAVKHYQMTKLALQAGKDVLVEKPLALQIKEGEELAELANEKNRVLMIGHILEYHPAVRKLVQMVGDGELGKISYIYSNRLNLGKFRTEENILWSFAPHDISVILRLLGEAPKAVSAYGGEYLNKEIADVTVTNMSFASGVKAHIFVSWLHPFKEQKLVVVGSDKMAVFDDLSSNKLLLYPHKVNWVGRCPVAEKGEAEVVKVTTEEPLKEECKHFLDCVAGRNEPLTGAENALAVLSVLTASQESLVTGGKKVELTKAETKEAKDVFIHPSSIVDDGTEIGAGSKIWHFSHVMTGAKLGHNCNLGQNVFVGKNVQIGNNVKIQNNVSVYEGVTLEDDVFCGPSCVFTNVKKPRSAYPLKDGEDYAKTLVKKGATIGANSTIICGVTIGEYSIVGAGAVATKNVPDNAVVAGNPHEIKGWACRCGKVFDKKEELLNCNCA